MKTGIMAPHQQSRRLRFRLEGFVAAILTILLFNLYNLGPTAISKDFDNTDENYNSSNEEDYNHRDDAYNSLHARDHDHPDSHNMQNYGSGSSSSSSKNRHHRLITVVGLESSGTTFVATTIAKALGYTKSHAKDLFQNSLTLEMPTLPQRTTSNSIGEEDNAINSGRKTWVQHVSLPSGYYTENHAGFHRRFELPPTVQVVVPDECRIPARYPYQSQQRQRQNPLWSSATATQTASSGARKRPTYPKTVCRDVLNMESMMEYPRRFFLNLTSHIQWYQNIQTRGNDISNQVDVTVVIVVRDKSLHFRGILKTHCPNETAANGQYEYGRYLIQEAMLQYKQRQQQQIQQQQVGHDDARSSSSNNYAELILVSYETLMTLQDTYLIDLYEQLGITPNVVDGKNNDVNSNSLHYYIPRFVDGNAKYVSAASES